ncbi:HAMP domain-containing sensor histidine kinase [Yoonia sp. 2307UL14-13]|uniref:HAMP domain-containing sensor histidine kinase n=1 Tax=Yoonia sp. 2307UL14-13 TaxID=3126506 RepID=UPI0030AA8500
MISLRTRAVVAGIIWASFAILIGVFGLARYLENQTQSQFNEQLLDRHLLVAIEVANYADTPDRIAQAIANPVYLRPMSGQYWQVTRPDGMVYVSPSLGDARLPDADPGNQGIQIVNFVGPRGDMVRGVEERITLEDGSVWTVQVASSLLALTEDRARLRNNLAVAFGLIAVIGIISAFLQVTATLRPLNALRRDVLTRWNTEGNLEPDGYPLEVAPLVNDINTLIERNRGIVSRSRRQAADLAHAIKTPAAIVRNELESLRSGGQPVQRAIDALDRLDAQLKRSFARMRADGGNAAVQTFTDLDTSLGRLLRAFRSMAQNENKRLEIDLPKGLRVRMDQADFEEVMGNLIDNAMKWSQSQISITVKKRDSAVEIKIQDDGPGIPEDAYEMATLSGQRLDTSKPGTGLGLAIAADLAHAYGGKVSLSVSDRLGGLAATVHLKTSGL